MKCPDRLTAPETEVMRHECAEEAGHEMPHACRCGFTWVGALGYEDGWAWWDNLVAWWRAL